MEDDGLYLNIGDLVYVTGIKDYGNGQKWEQYGELYDSSILQVSSSSNFAVATGPGGYSQQTYILTGAATGQTVFQIEKTGPCLRARKVEIEFFVDSDRKRRHRREEEEESDHEDNK